MGTVTAPDATAVGHSQLGEGVERIDVGSRPFQSSSLAGSRADYQSFSGRPPQNEDDVLAVCSVLRQVLRDEGEHWGPFELQLERADDVDAFAHDDADRILNVQVRRVDTGAWQVLGSSGEAEQHLNARQLADAVVDAIRSKTHQYPTAQRADLLLALDARRAPAFVQRQVRELLRNEHRDEIATSGFRAVWLIGPTAALTNKLS